MTNITPLMDCTAARNIAGNPQPTHTQHLRTLAWAMLMTARGQRMVQSRIPRNPDPLDAA